MVFAFRRSAICHCVGDGQVTIRYFECEWKDKVIFLKIMKRGEFYVHCPDGIWLEQIDRSLRITSYPSQKLGFRCTDPNVDEC